MVLTNSLKNHLRVMKSADKYLILFKGVVCLMAAVQTAFFSIFDYLPSPPYSGLVIITKLQHL